MTVGSHLAAHLRLAVNFRPHAHHQSHVHAVQAVGHEFRGGVVGLVEAHGVPAVLAPVLPVLHDDVHGQLLLAEAVGSLQYFFLRVETLAAVYVAQCPLRHQRSLARQLAVGGYDFVGRAYEHRVVHGLRHGRLEHRLLVHLPVVDFWLVVLRQFGCQRVATFLEVYDGRGRRRQPYVAHVYNRFAVDAEVVAARHLLAHVQHQGVVALLANGEHALKAVVLPHLLLAALGRGHADGLPLAAACLSGQRHLAVAGVEVGQSVVVPQHAVALARDEHRDGYLRVHLRKTSRQSAHVQHAVLKLSQSVETFVVGRAPGQPCLVGGLSAGRCGAELVGRGHEHRLAVEAFHLHGLLLLVNVHGEGLFARRRRGLHVDPFRQRVYHGSLRVLYSDGIAGQRGEPELSLAEWYGAAPLLLGSHAQRCPGQQRREHQTAA